MNMSSTGTHRKKTCTKCSKFLKVYLRCFKCNAVYHAKCFLKAPGFQADQEGHAFCCRNIISESDPSKEVLASEEKPVLVKQEEEYDSDKGSLVCSICNEEMFQKDSYERHVSWCKIYYSRLNTVNDVGIEQHNSSTYHILSKDCDGKKQYNCNECTFSTHTKYSLEGHLRTHTNEKPFKCDCCDYRATVKRSLKDHIKAKHSNAEKEYRCSECKYSTYAKAHLVNHVRIHTNEKPFKCNSCDYATARRSALSAHALAKHSNAEEKYKCTECKYSTHKKWNLVNHERIHTNERPFKCDRCEYAASRRSELNSHILAKHSNAEKRYKCSDCEYSAYRKSHLVNHTRVHTNEKPFKCGASKKLLEIHVVTKHSNLELGHKCSCCKYTTYIKGDLVKHMRVHTNERPFKCDMCDYAAAQKSNLASHVLAKHSSPENGCVHINK